MYTPSANPREDFWQGIYAILKIFLGALVGFTCGEFQMDVIVGLILWALMIAILFIAFRYIIKLEDAPIKLILMHGTFASFIAFVLFWGIVIGPPH